MKSLFKNTSGASVAEFAMVALPVCLFILGIMQTGWIVWVDNALYVSVDTAARCGAVNSTTPPCNGTDMVTAANRVFAPLSGATFTANSTCTTDVGSGLIGTYKISILSIELKLTAQSCYPSVLG